MSAETLASVLDALARGELDGVAARFAEDGVYREARKAPIRGRDAIAAEFARYASSGTAFRFDVDDVIGSARRFCVVYRFTTAASGGDGEPWRERAGCATVTFDHHGRIAQWREYEG